MNLQGLCILITRPPSQSNKLAELIRGEGGEVVEFPTIEITDPQDEGAIRRALANVHFPATWIFISPNAVTRALPYIQKAWTSLPKSIELIAVGEGTSHALQARGFSTVNCPAKGQFNSEGVLALPSLQSISGKQIVIFKGEGGRELLADSLRARGAFPIEINVYRRVLPNIDVDAILSSTVRNNVSAVIVTSADSLKNLLILVGEQHRLWLLSRRLIVSGERLAQLAKEWGFVSSPLIADNASDRSIIMALSKWKTEILHEPR